MSTCEGHTTVRPNSVIGKQPVVAVVSHWHSRFVTDAANREALYQGELTALYSGSGIRCSGAGNGVCVCAHSAGSAQATT